MTYEEMNEREAKWMYNNGWGLQFDLPTIEGITITQKLVQREEKPNGGYRKWSDEVTAADIERVRKHHKFDMQ